MNWPTLRVFIGIISVSTLLLALTYQWTLPNILHNQQQAELAALSELVPTNQYDNDLLGSKISVVSPQDFGTTQAITIYVAKVMDPAVKPRDDEGKPRDHADYGRDEMARIPRNKSKTTAVVFATIAPDGYGGPINLLVGVNPQGEIIGVRILRHNETPGLGDKMELGKSNWVTSFDQHSLLNTPKQAWQVRKNGGAFDSWTGATITPQAIVQAVWRVLQYTKLHHQELFSPHE